MEPMLRFKADDGSDFPDWEEMTLGDVGSVAMCKRVFKEQTHEVGDVPFFKIGTFGDVPDAYISQSLFDELKSKYAYPKVGTILLSASGTIGRQVEYNGEDAYYQDSNIVWLEHDDTVLDSYLKQFYSVVKWQGLEGSTIKRLYNKTILDTPFYRPSLPEQRKIADLLSAVDDVIAAQEAEVAAWEKRMKGVMQKLFSQEVRFKADDGSDFPDWEERTFADVFIKLHNNTLSRDCLNAESGQARNIHYGDVLVKYGFIVDIQNNQVPFVNSDVECKRWDRLKDGDIVIADTAEDDSVGKAVEVTNIGSEVVYSGLHTIACRPRESFARNYLGYYMNSDAYAALGHWHDDIEFSLVLSGGMDYNVNGEMVHLNPGEGIFINSRQMHFNFSREHQNGEYICILLHPMLLCASQYVEDNFVAPVLNHPTFSYQVFHAGCDWGRRVCDKLKWMYARQSQPKFQLAIQAAFLQIWEEVYQHAPLSSKSVKSRGQNLNALKDMVAYIQKNYQKKIKLEDIARAGNVSKTTCINIFQKYVNKTPNAYLMEFRLRNGIELLNTTDMTVTEISFEVGFCGSSYFCESFKKVFGCSPLQFRKSPRNIDTDKQKELEILL